MNLTSNINFTRYGNSKERIYFFAVLLFLLSLRCYAGSPINSVDSLVRQYKQDDDVENFIYSCLDLYLENPSEERISLFQQFDHYLWRALQTQEERLAHVILLCNQGFYLSRFGNIQQGILAYEKAWNIYHEYGLTGFDIIEYCLKPLGNNYTMLGDYSGAEGIVNTYFQLAEREKNYEHLAGAIINLSIIYHDTGKPDSAIRLLLDLEKNKNIPPEKRGLLFSNLAKNYAATRDFDKASSYARLSISLFKKYPQFDTPGQIITVFKTLAAVELHKGDTLSALTVLEEAQQMAHRYQTALTVRDRAKLNTEYGNLLTIADKMSKAIFLYQKALQLLLPSYQPEGSQALPDPNSFYAENTIKEALDGLGNAYEKLHQPLLAIGCYERSFAVEDLLRSTFNYQYSKLLQQVENRNRAERVLTLLYNQYLQTKNYEFCLKAFQVAERTKALTLKDIADRNNARKNLSTDTLVHREKELLFKQATILNDLAQEKSKPTPDNEALHDLFSKQTQITLTLKEVQQQLDSRQPAVGNARKGWVNISHIQRKLADEKASLVEYFVGEHLIFHFILNHDSLIVYAQAHSTTVDKRLRKFINLFTSSSTINNDVANYKLLAFNVYKDLFHKLNSLNNERIILIPDGILHFLPFDALLYSSTESTSYSVFPFFGKKFKLSYEASAYLYAFDHEVPYPLTQQKVVGFFPIFERTDRALQYSEKEGDNIHHLFKNGKYLWREQATKENFIKLAGEYSIVHLSTHAEAGAETALPAIHFIDSILYLPEIYGLNLHSDLMVLSACETGIGKLAKGEGVLSLAHGFQSAGVRNIILTLWNVNDQSTAWLMSDFYSNYLDSGNKAEALWQAKLDYLSNKEISNNRKSPYYWAGFVYYGDYEALPEEPTGNKILWLFCLSSLVLALGIGWSVKKKRNKRTSIS